MSSSSELYALDVAARVIRFTSIRHPLVFYGGFGAAALLEVCILGVGPYDTGSNT
jgi:hypothetical protein